MSNQRNGCFFELLDLLAIILTVLVVMSLVSTKWRREIVGGARTLYEDVRTTWNGAVP